MSTLPISALCYPSFICYIISRAITIQQVFFPWYIFKKDELQFKFKDVTNTPSVLPSCKQFLLHNITVTVGRVFKIWNEIRATHRLCGNRTYHFYFYSLNFVPPFYRTSRDEMHHQVFMIYTSDLSL